VFSGTLGRSAWWAALALLAISALRVILEPTERAALAGYRYAVHAADRRNARAGSATLGEAGTAVAILDCGRADRARVLPHDPTLDR
jgi:hypothetical protein